MSEERIKDLEAQVAHERQIAGFLRDARNAEITRLRELELALEKAEADKLAAVKRMQEAAADLIDLAPQTIRLMLGEMSAQEMRTCMALSDALVEKLYRIKADEIANPPEQSK